MTVSSHARLLPGATTCSGAWKLGLGVCRREPDTGRMASLSAAAASSSGLAPPPTPQMTLQKLTSVSGWVAHGSYFIHRKPANRILHPRALPCMRPHHLEVPP